MPPTEPYDPTRDLEALVSDIPHRGKRHAQFTFRAGARPSGKWAREVNIYVSPTGRSVRVWVDGHEVPKR